MQLHTLLTHHTNTTSEAHTDHTHFFLFNFSAAVQSAASHMTGLPRLTEHAQTPVSVVRQNIREQ